MTSGLQNLVSHTVVVPFPPSDGAPYQREHNTTCWEDQCSCREWGNCGSTSVSGSEGTVCACVLSCVPIEKPCIMNTYNCLSVYVCVCYVIYNYDIWHSVYIILDVSAENWYFYITLYVVYTDHIYPVPADCTARWQWRWSCQLLLDVTLMSREGKGGRYMNLQLQCSLR